MFPHSTSAATRQGELGLARGETGLARGEVSLARGRGGLGRGNASLSQGRSPFAQMEGPFRVMKPSSGQIHPLSRKMRVSFQETNPPSRQMRFGLPQINASFHEGNRNRRMPPQIALSKSYRLCDNLTPAHIAQAGFWEWPEFFCAPCGAGFRSPPSTAGRGTGRG